MRVALAACLLVVPTLAFPGETTEGSGSGSGSGAGNAPSTMPAFRGSSAQREDAIVDFEIPAASDMQPSMDFTAQVNPTVASRELPRGAPQHRGTLTAAQVDGVLRTAFPKTLQCYKQMAAGKKVDIVTTFVIAADGSVVDAKIESTTFPNATFEKCMRTVLLGLDFPAPDGNGIVDVRTPFTFYP